MFPTDKNRIALISVHGDPAVETGREEAGGQNVYVLQVGEALARQGWQVDMFTRRSDPDQPGIVKHSENCRTIRLTAGPAEFIGRDHLFDYLPEFIQAFQKFQQQENLHYPLIHTNYWLSSWVGMQLRKLQPMVQVHTYHSLGAIKYQAIDGAPAIATKRLDIEKQCLETVHRVVATSPQEEEHMRQYVSPNGRIEMIPCGTDLKRFGNTLRPEARQQLGISSDTKVVLYAGRFDKRKGIETLVRAVAQSTLRGQADLKLIIAGGSTPGQSDGLERDRIEGIVTDLGIQDITVFPGRLDVELPTYYAAADVCVVPSHYEPFGLVPIEAMACRTPIVASNVGGLQFTVVPEVTGLLVPPKDVDGFAQAIDRILANPAWRDELGQTGRHRVEIAFSWDSVAARLSNLYQRLLTEAAEEVTPIKPERAPVAVEETQVAA